MEGTSLQINYDEIKAYIKNLDFKKVMRGVREDEVYAAIQRLDEMYRVKINALSDECAKSAVRIHELDTELAGEKELRGQLEEKLADMETTAQDYETKSGQMARMMAGIQEMRDSLISDAQAEADRLISEAEQSVSALEELCREQEAKIQTARSEAIAELNEISEMFRRINERAASGQNAVEKNIRALEDKRDSAS